MLKGLGVSKAAADKLDLIYKSVSPAAAKRVVKAVNAFLKHKIPLRLAAELEVAVGKRPSADVISSIIQFAEAIELLPTQVDPDITERAEKIAIYAEVEGTSLEDAEFFLEETGQIEVGEYTGMEDTGPNKIDDYLGGPNDPRDESDPNLRSSNPDLKHTNPSRGDRLVLSRAMDKVRSFFDRLQRPDTDGVVKAVKAIFAGKLKGIQDVTIQEVLDQLATVLPKNHRYAILVRRLQQLGLTAPVKFYESHLDVDPAGKAGATYKHGLNVGQSIPGRATADNDQIEIRIKYIPD